jgi:hypothetical protein
VEQYVFLADGQVGSAIGCLRDGLRLRRAVQRMDAWLGSVQSPGNAGAMRLIDALGRRVDQLAVRDCDQLGALVREELAMPEPVLAQLEEMRRLRRAGLEQWRTNPDTLLWPLELRERFAAPKEPSERIRALRSELERLIQEQPTSVKGLVDQLSALLERSYDQAFSEYKRPSWERRPLQLREESLAERYFATVFGEDNLYQEVMEPIYRATGWQTRLQLLGVHAAINRFRWENARLPRNLAEISLGDMAVDLYTGQPFPYEPARRPYRLYSAGPWERPDAERPASGNRRPVSVPAEDARPPDA